MSDTFSWSRFGNLFKLHFRTHMMSLLLSVGIFWGVFGGLHLLVANIVNDPTGFMLLQAFIMACAFGALSFVCAVQCSRCFSAYHHRNQASAFMLLPCSKLEQFLMLFLIYVILIPFILGGGTLLMERFVMIESFESAMAANNAGEVEPFAASSTELVKALTVSTAWLSVFSTQSVFFAGAIWFKSRQLLKTCVVWGAVLALLIVLSFIFKDLASELLGEWLVAMNPMSESKDSDLFNIISNGVILCVMTALAGFKFYRHKMP